MARLKSIVLSALVGVSLLLSAELWLVGTPGLVVNDTPYAAPIRFDRERDPLVLAQPTAIGVADGDRRWLIAPEASEATAVWAWVRGLEVDRMQSPEAIAEGDARKTDAAGGRGSEEPADPGQNGPSAKTALWLSWPSGLPANVWQALFPTWPKPSLSAVDALWVEREGSALRAVVYAVSEGRKQAIDLLAPQDGAIDAWRDVIDVATPTADGAPSVPPHRIPVATGKDAPETVTPAPEAEASVREPALEAFWRPLPEAGSALPTYVLRLQPIDAESAAEALITDVTAMRQARERDGSRLFTDGARSLRIDERAGMLEYFAPVTGPVRPMPENAYETAVQFVNRHAGWTGEFRLAAARESAAEVQFAFHLAVDGWPVLDGAPSVYLLSVGVQGRSVVSYERGLYRPLGMDEDGARLLPDARDVARALQAMGRPASDVARIQVAYAAQPTRTAGVFRLVPGLYVALGDGAARFLTVADELTPAGGEDAAGAPKTRTGEGGGQR
ncbi:MAG: hypothetical protein IMW86_08565 [Hydrogenibacillus sp.]|nr:hypothetical protein [Hydrogenibacillus sp.]